MKLIYLIIFWIPIIALGQPNYTITTNNNPYDGNLFFLTGKSHPYNRCSGCEGRVIIILPWNEVLLLFFYVISLPLMIHKKFIINNCPFIIQILQYISENENQLLLKSAKVSGYVFFQNPLSFFIRFKIILIKT